MNDGQTWYYAENGAQRGPYSEAQMTALVRDGALARETLVWNPGLTEWTALGETSLGGLLPAVPPPPPPPPPPAGSGSVPSVGAPSLAKNAPAGAPAPAAAGAPPHADARPAPDDADLSMWDYFVRAVTRDYVGFQGRARRKEYWSYVLFSFLIIVGATFVAALLFGEELGNVVNGLLGLAFLLPGLAALVRRLHDGGYSGWLVLLLLIPFLGFVALLVLAVLPTEPRPNKHGPVPAGVDVA
ncbi:DUF805 domain-containing protein [Salinarimonas sp.]|uniref:DUF805 domain-containing protein n=1 Tax=Salinarimonas sp. TaxID=2766526 RepID=UPI0032D90C95